MAFKTDDGKSLQVSKPVQMNVPAEVLGKVDEDNAPGSPNPLRSIKMYSMDPNDAMWKEIGSLDTTPSRRRRKRQRRTYGVTIAGISPTSEWYNFDAVATTTCISKIRIFGSEDFKKDNQISGAQVYAFIKGDDDTYSFSTRLVYNNDATKGYCIVHRCDRPNYNANGFKGYLVAKKEGKYLVPAVNNTGLGVLESQLEYKAFDDKLEVKYSLEKDMKGPFYDWKNKWIYSPDCVAAPFEDPHFRFHLQKEDQCYQFQDFTFKDALTDQCKPHYYKSWYRASEIAGSDFTTCYMKVQIAHYTSSVKVQAFSRVGTFVYIDGTDSKLSIQPGQNYGFHENCTVGGVACIKVKPPGRLGCSTIPSHEHPDDYTHVSVTARYKATGNVLNVSDVNANLRDEHPVIKEDVSFGFRMKSSGTFGGLFCYSHLLKTKSDIEAHNMCLESGQEEYAVKFGSKFKYIY